MQKKLVNAENLIGPPVTRDEYTRKILRRRLFRELGLSPIGYTDRTNSTLNKKCRNPFSTIYKTEKEFLQAKLKALDYLTNNQDVPTELYNNIVNTLKELEPIYGDKYNYL